MPNPTTTTTNSNSNATTTTGQYSHMLRGYLAVDGGAYCCTVFLNGAVGELVGTSLYPFLKSSEGLMLNKSIQMRVQEGVKDCFLQFKMESKGEIFKFSGKISRKGFTALSGLKPSEIVPLLRFDIRTKAEVQEGQQAVVNAFTGLKLEVHTLQDLQSMETVATTPVQEGA